MGHEAKTGFDALVTEGPCVPAPSPGRGTAWGPLPLRQAGPAEHGDPQVVLARGLLRSPGFHEEPSSVRWQPPLGGLFSVRGLGFGVPRSL